MVVLGSKTTTINPAAETLASHLQFLNAKEEKLTGLLYFYDISGTRLGGISARNIRMFRALVEQQRQELKTKFWGDVIEASTGYEELLDLERMLQLRQGHNLSDTAVGKIVREEFTQLQEEHEKDIRSIQQALDVAKKKKEKRKKKKENNNSEIESVLEALQNAQELAKNYSRELSNFKDAEIARLREEQKNQAGCTAM
ncbi:hypothetical protein BGAL_0557g00010 [Botrytis galanthina]|uniref:Uncharacterized protein n=1 Tax=Botrytis galanthina TaxID=278940 RepID=A0A4S8QJC4_9HELO|nr:hypothetical protein BGAL_0557g00010 [Botrytis galanthina]